MKKTQTPITQAAWQSLKSGDGIQDELGRIWEVTRRSNSNTNKLFVRCPGYDEELLTWADGQILDEEHAILLELHHPSVIIINQD